jgi:GGDEF domain-containing protein
VKYISIDGDDVGRRITACYISNNEKGLQEISKNLETSTRKISSLLVSLGFKVLFCAADGVVASTEKTVNFTNLFESISSLAPEGISYSAGVGDTLREAYIALQAAKSNGKNRFYECSEIATNQGDNAT